MICDCLGQKIYSMEDFGSVRGSTKEVRINKIDHRIKPKVPFPHKHDFYKIMAVSSGSGWHEIDFYKYNIQSLQIFFVKPGQVHDWEIPTKTLGYFVEFDKEALIYNSISSHLSSSLNQLPDHFDLLKSPEAIQRRLWDLLRLMFNEYCTGGSNFEISLRHYLMALLIELRRLSPGKMRVVNDSLIERFQNLVEDNYCSEPGIEFYADALRMTPKALTMRAKRSLGKSAGGIIQGRRLLEAKRLLAYSNHTISQLAYEVGFDDPNYFSRFFRKATRMSPGDFRQKINQKFNTPVRQSLETIPQ